MDVHRGQVVEYQVRKSGMNISELCKQLDINRSSLYNWFGQKNLSLRHVYRIGVALKYDFANKIPELSKETVMKEIATLPENNQIIVNAGNDKVWKDKYMILLEQYVELIETKNSGDKTLTGK